LSAHFQLHFLCYIAHLQFHVRVGIAAATILSKSLEKAIEGVGFSHKEGKKTPVINKSRMEQVVCIFRTKYLQSVNKEEKFATRATDVPGYLARLKGIISSGRFETDLDLALVSSAA